MSAVLKDQSERSDDWRMLADAVTTFVERATSIKRVRALRDTQPGFDRNLWGSIAEQGWLGIHVPEQYGGQGLGFTELGIVARGLGGALIPEPVTACAVLATGALLHGDNEALKKKLIPQMVEGKLIVALPAPISRPRSRRRRTQTALRSPVPSVSSRPPLQPMVLSFRPQLPMRKAERPVFTTYRRTPRVSTSSWSAALMARSAAS